MCSYRPQGNSAQAEEEQAARVWRLGSSSEDSCGGRAHFLSQLAHLVSPLHSQKYVPEPIAPPIVRMLSCTSA